jgi:isoquinoline 1-oxidoreductase beta subunit
MENKTTKKKFSRRKFLQGGAIILGGTIVTTYLSRSPIRRFLAQTIENLDVQSMISTYKPSFWFEILLDNTILLKSPKVEMGQGIFTGFAMLAAEELEVPLEQIRVEHANTTTGPVDRVNTGGSNSTSSLYESIREVAATMREMLKTAAAEKWGVDAGKIAVQKGVLTFENQTMTYAEVVKSTEKWKVPKMPELKPASEFKYVGKEVKRIDLQPKVLGKPIYGIDHTFPEMLYAVLLQSPYIGGILKKVNTRAAAEVPDVVKIIEEKEFVAVVANNRYAAQTALDAIEAEWEVPKKWQYADFEKMVTVGNGYGTSVQKEGNPVSILKKEESTVFKQAYRTPLAAHAQLEVNGTVAHVEADKATIVIGTQAPGMVRGQVANAIDLKNKQVTLEVAYLGGAFGRRVHVHNAREAARISQIVGKPIHLFNTREQEFQHSHYRPNTHHVLQAVIQNGQITAITHDQATPDMVLEAAAGDVAIAVAGADFISAGHGASILYNIPNKAATVWHADLPIPTGIWRSVGLFPNTFAVESFVNELAHELRKDPLTLRMEWLKGDEKINLRYQNVLKTLEEKSGWKTPAPKGVGRGVAICNDRKTIAACVVEVAVIDEQIQVKKVIHVTDAGKIINPDGIRMQVEGCVMWGTSAALYEQLRIEDGQIASTNYHEYPMATLKDTPDIEVILLEGEEIPYGVGEPPLGPIAPAIAAAVWEVTGQRLRDLPLKVV